MAQQTIRHDYRPGQRQARGLRPHAGWFIAGIGVPLMALGFVLPERGGPPPSPLELTAPITPPAIALLELPEGFAEAGETIILEVRPGDSLDRLFRQNGLSTRDLAALMQLEPARRNLRILRPGDRITVRHDEGALLELSREIGLDSALSVTRGDEGFSAELVSLELERRVADAAGQIRSSLFGAASEAGISDRTIMNLASIFAWDIDFVLDIREGDQFTVVYEELWRDGEKVSEGAVLAAEFINQGRRYRAVRHEDPNGQVAYFTPEGQAMRKAFLRAPLSFTRISSNFNPNRRHPILNTIRAHRGVDYAAPTGTPVMASGNGRIIFRGWQNGYGNTVIIQHSDNITTLYAHLSRFNPQFPHGARVRQGDVIAYVGATGLATAPHLHYEFRRNGVHLDPLRVTLPDADPIPPSMMASFREATSPLLERLDSSASRQTLLASTASGN
ncbi:MAG: peptidoglycan DD-metalloendopeptidase family protein [Chromatiales bacterium]|nr:peptidoglycan DD-metalloendopeptidase family protein [Chromatiales bacterium]